MSRIKEWLRVIILSPEVLVVAILIGIAVLKPSIFKQVGQLVESFDPKITAVLIGFPFALTTLVYRIGKNILNPEEHRQVLIDWPEYEKLKITVFAAFVFCGASCVAIVVGWILVLLDHLTVGATMMISALFVSTITLATVAVAQLNGKDILDGAV